MVLFQFLYVNGTLTVKSMDIYHTAKSNVWIQCNSYQNPNGILYRNFKKS